MFTDTTTKYGSWRISKKYAIIYVDECETLFPRREVMTKYQSVEVTRDAEFLEQAEAGYQTPPPLLYLTTNNKLIQDLENINRIANQLMPNRNACHTTSTGYNAQDAIRLIILVKKKNNRASHTCS